MRRAGLSRERVSSGTPRKGGVFTERVALGHFHERVDECPKINEFVKLKILSFRLTIYQKAKSKA